MGPRAGTAGFGRFGGDLLVGNFGDGRINAFAPDDEHGHQSDRVHVTADHGGDSGHDGGPDGNGDDHGHDGGQGHDDHGMQFEPRGALRGDRGKPIVIDGLWALEFGMGGANNGPATTLFFTAGPDDESNGLFGTITAS